jgi:ATP-dependent Clp protease ATP-binding subunit ClpC
VFERFTDTARRVIVLAQEEARMLRHDYIGTEHILLGLIREEGCVASRSLVAAGLSLSLIREEVIRVVGQGTKAPTEHIPFTPRAKKVLELSLREALQLGHNYIGTEHILLGLIREGEGVAAQVIQKLGADLNQVRRIVTELLADHAGPAPEEAAEGDAEDTPGAPAEVRAPTTPVAPLEEPPTCPSCFASLAETARLRRIRAEDRQGVSADVLVVYCERCGVAIGTA